MERDHLEDDLGVDRIILKWILKLETIGLSSEFLAAHFLGRLTHLLALPQTACAI